MSIRRQLIWLVAGTAATVLIAFFVPLAAMVDELVAEEAVADASLEVQTLVPIIVRDDDEALRMSVGSVNDGGPIKVSVFYADGRIVGAPSPRTAGVELATRGYSLIADVPGGREVLTSVVGRAEGPVVLRAFVPRSVLEEGVPLALLTFAVLGAVLLVLALVVAIRLAGRLTRPIRELAEVSQRLAAGSLDARARGSGSIELVEVSSTVNYLARRIKTMVTEERERIADLSHRLRTPLTALRLEAELLADPREQERLNAAVDGVERAVTDAITTVRAAGGGENAVDAAAVLRERVDFWSVLADEQGRDIRVDLAEGPLPVAVGRAELADAVDVLLGNVFSHTPHGTAFEVALKASQDGGAILEAGDEGPGFPDGAAVRRGRSGGGSTGLGLDIVRRVAEASGGEVTLGRTEAGGGLVRVHLGPPDDG